ncbi:hypothetical protein ELI30_25270 (plasmid) [Rhizobium leguminosarum]|nr:hypothetical protein ELI31_35195 [Rhizobium leguminosarum]TAV48011.1 hypothetical protein ELI32_07120 [Rhizobium leguminosarum]TAV63407.1 hypothetical protein ELI30_25270 [Rhizobium leguminosarum]TAY60530.1 hypothetical protein ELH82_33830 [Rhizobium leguminosarum]
MAIEHRSLSPVPNRCDCIHRRKSFVNRATSYNLKHLPTGNKDDFAQYEKMISIEEYSSNVILYCRTFTEAHGIAASRNRTSRDRCLSTPGNRDHRSRDLIVTDAEIRFHNDSGSSAARMFELR